MGSTTLTTTKPILAPTPLCSSINNINGTTRVSFFSINIRKTKRKTISTPKQSQKVNPGGLHNGGSKEIKTKNNPNYYKQYKDTSCIQKRTVSPTMVSAQILQAQFKRISTQH